MESDSRVKVFVRARPVLPNERGGKSCIKVDDVANVVRLCADVEAPASNEDARSVAFDAAFPAEASQQEVFAKLGLPVLRECLQGVNGTILAYGQTGSGKTHSLLQQGAAEAGLLPRLVATLFAQVAQDPANVYDIDAAAMQVYNEQVDDLLQSDVESGAGLGLQVQNGGLVPGLTRVTCESPSVLLEAFARARSNLIYAETRMNKASSRSHAIFQISITRRARVSSSSTAERCQQMACTHAKLNVVDLAGSERVKKSGVEGVHLREASAINRSLLAFGNVVSALAAKRSHVPYRDSKLTRILEGSIGGNSKTALLACVSPLLEHAAETLSALELARRAMRVEVDAQVNVSVVEVSSRALRSDLDALSEQAYVQEIVSLRAAKDEAEEQWQRERSQLIQQAEQESQEIQEALAKQSDRADMAEETLRALQVELDRVQQEAQQAQAEREEIVCLRTASVDAEEHWKVERIQVIEQHEQESQDMREALVKQSKRADVAEETLQALQTELDRLQKDAQQAQENREEIVSLRAAFVQAEEQWQQERIRLIERAEQESQEMQEALTKQAQRADAVEETLRALQTELEGVQNDAEQAQMENEEILSLRAASVKAVVERAEQESQEMQEALAKQSKRADVAEERLRAVQTELDRVQNGLHHAQTEREEIASLRTAFVHAEEQWQLQWQQERIQLIERAEQESQGKRKALAKQSKRADEAEERLRALQTELERVNNDLRQAQMEREEIASLRAAFVEAEEQCQLQWRQERIQLIERAEQESQGMRKALAKQSKRADTAEEKLRALQTELDKVQNQMHQVQMEKEELKEEVATSARLREVSHKATEGTQAHVADWVSETAASSEEAFLEALRKRDEAVQHAIFVGKEEEVDELVDEVSRGVEEQHETEESLRQWQEKALKAMRRAEALQGEVARAFHARANRPRSEKHAATCASLKRRGPASATTEHSLHRALEVRCP